jgi:rod shape-determining protein MreC
MPLGTLDRTPPPFFRQGPSALTKLAFFSALAVFLMVADTRLNLAQPVRQVLAVVLLPLQRAVTVPLEAAAGGTDYLRGLERALADERRAREQATALAERAARAEQLQLENTRLRALLEMRPALVVQSTPAELLYEAADPYSRKVFIDRGLTHGVKRGAPVINEAGVLGQVTQVYPLASEVTLLADKDAAIPVLNTRTQQRSAAFGGGRLGGMELRFLSGNADVQPGDRLATSGLDGVYPPGLPVATVVAVDRRSEGGFARIRLEPDAQADGVRHVLVLEPVGLQQPPRPGPAEAPASLKPEKAPRPRPGVPSP